MTVCGSGSDRRSGGIGVGLLQERAAAVCPFGFTPRQARFLVLVLEHAGVCLPRQYRTFSGIAHGRETHRFFERLIADGFATTDLAAPAHAGRIYRVQYKPWYRLLGDRKSAKQVQSPTPVSRSIPAVVMLRQSVDARPAARAR